MNNIPTTVLLADDHPVFRRGLRMIIASDPQFTVLDEAADGLHALARIRELRPDVALLDINMPQQSGIEVARTLQREQLNTRVVFLTMHRDEATFNAALDLGAATEQRLAGRPRQAPRPHLAQRVVGRRQPQVGGQPARLVALFAQARRRAAAFGVARRLLGRRQSLAQGGGAAPGPVALALAALGRLHRALAGEHRVEAVRQLSKFVVPALQRDPVGERAARTYPRGVGDAGQRGKHATGEEPSANQAKDQQKHQRDSGGRGVFTQVIRVVPRDPGANGVEKAVGVVWQEIVGRWTILPGDPRGEQHQSAGDHEKAGIAQGELGPGAQPAAPIHRRLRQLQPLTRRRCGSRRRGCR